MTTRLGITIFSLRGYSSFYSLIYFLNGLLILSFLFTPLQLNSNNCAHLHSIEFHSLPDNIEERIFTAFEKDFNNKRINKLNSIIDELNQIREPKNELLYEYWKSFALFFKAVYFKEIGEKSQASDIVDRAIEQLQNVESKFKNKATIELLSEYYTLLAWMQSFSIQFNYFKARSLFKLADSNIEKAKQLNPKNPRVYFILGTLDFYTPKFYGGKEKTENYLLKALSLPFSFCPDKTYPTYGEARSYALLVKYYLEFDELEKAESHYNEAIKKFPDSHKLLELKSEFE